MLTILFLLISLSMVNAVHITKLASEITLLNEELSRDEPLSIQGVKKINKGLIEHVIFKNCTGVLHGETFRNLPNLSKLTIWRSNIQEINSTLPITKLLVLGSHIPNLDADLQQKLPKLQVIMLLANKNFQVDSQILKNFKYLQALHISEANFTENCINKHWFKGLEALQELGLSDNGIDCITEDAFNSLINLRKLDLTYNHIPNLDKRIFKKLTKLEKLGLYENNVDRLDLSTLASQKSHLEELGISWQVLRDSDISAQDLLQALPNLKFISFGHKEMPNDFKAGEFCQILRQNEVNCKIDGVFGVSKILGYSRSS